MTNPLAAFIREQMHNARIETLSTKSVEELKALWDRDPKMGLLLSTVIILRTFT